MSASVNTSAPRVASGNQIEITEKRKSAILDISSTTETSRYTGEKIGDPLSEERQARCRGHEQRSDDLRQQTRRVWVDVGAGWKRDKQDNDNAEGNRSCSISRFVHYASH